MSGRAAVAVALGIGAISIGCVSKNESPNRQALQPVVLPDVSRLVGEPVRAQLRERYASLTSMIESPATLTSGAADLGGAYGEMGRLFMAAEYFAAAEPCFLNAQTLAPKDRRWPYYLGRVYRQQGDTLKSAAAFDRALQLRPDDTATLVWLGRAYLDLGRTEAAEPLFTKALVVDSRSAAALYGLGRAALDGHDYARAADYLERALALDERASILRYPLAMAYRGLGQTDKAEAELRQRGDGDVGLADPLMEEAVELLETPAAYEMRAMRASSAGDWKSAVGYLRKGIALAPEHAELRAKLGIALSTLSISSTTSTTGDRAGAEEQFEAALRLSPGLAAAHLGLGRLMVSSGRSREAIDQFEAAVKYAPNDLPSRFELAEALRQSGRAREAISHYAYVLRIDPRMVEARFGYAMALILLKRYPEARERLAEDTKRYPERPEFAQALARLR